MAQRWAASRPCWARSRSRNCETSVSLKDAHVHRRSRCRRAWDTVRRWAAYPPSLARSRLGPQALPPSTSIMALAVGAGDTASSGWFADVSGNYCCGRVEPLIRVVSAD